MSEILQSLQSPSWWVSVVLAGIAVNLLSAYAKPYVDSVLSRVSTGWRARRTQAVARRQAVVEQIRASSQLQMVLFIDELRAQLSSMFAYGATIFLIVLAMILDPGALALALAMLGLLMVLIAIYEQNRAQEIWSLLHEAGVTPKQLLRGSN